MVQEGKNALIIWPFLNKIHWLGPSEGGWMRRTTAKIKNQIHLVMTDGLHTFAARYIHWPIGTAVLHLHNAVMCRSCAQLILRYGNTAGSNRVSTSNRFSLIVLTKTVSVLLTDSAWLYWLKNVSTNNHSHWGDIDQWVFPISFGSIIDMGAATAYPPFFSPKLRKVTCSLKRSCRVAPSQLSPFGLTTSPCKVGKYL